ncbi:OLC1v1029732C1 [Oldenlandia corymbosa var. corymbosa]|uniref:OLC1v1029732C1 n=1 Tax=Oldenlandia corymbosa var. corymbosa TaxID=529605 RepID=A0AAV1CFC9_OLDCO|nr:OLC1v1029732C1 [Oldenlandia corymbosa var. corymbosa]
MNMSAQNGIASAVLTAIEEQLEAPLLDDQTETGGKPQKTPGQKVIRKTFKGTAHLANLLPTGSVLAFQMFSPSLTHEGKCQSIVYQSLTLGFLGLCAVSCFLLCFTDSIRDERGKVRYGVATFKGFRVLDGSIDVPPEDADKYKINFMDFFHAFMSLLIFGAVAMFDQNVMNCLYPNRSGKMQEILTIVPVVVGVVGSLMFVVFPSKRHGIGFPLSRN